MFSSATLADFYLARPFSAIPVPRGIGDSLLRGIPEFVLFLGISWLLVHFGHRASLADLGLGWNAQALRDLGLYLLAGAAAVSLVVLPLVAAGFGSFRSSEQTVQGWGQIALLVFLLFLAALGEEIFLRGYAFQTLIQPLHLLGALVTVNGIFAALHLGNPSVNEFAVANTFLAGCVLAMLVVVCRSLWAPVGAHFGWNLATPLLGVNLSGMPLPITPYSVEWHTSSFWTGGGYGPEASVLCTGLLLALLFSLVLVYYRRQDAVPPESA